MLIDQTVLTAMGVSTANADKHVEALNNAMLQHEINTPLRAAHFLSQICHESGCLRITTENMNYSASRLLQVFRRHFTPSLAREYARKAKRIGCRVYANRMGNGNEASGDGFRYRGRGFIQLTGKNNYRAFANWCGQDVVSDPDLVGNSLAAESSVFFWSSNNINRLADRDDVLKVTKRINGGTNGLQHRKELLRKAKRALAAADFTRQPEPQPLADFIATHRVSATQLNLRKKPKITASTRITLLPQGHPVAVIKASRVSGWVAVQVQLHGRLVDGFLSERHIEAIAAPIIPAVIEPELPSPAADEQPVVNTPVINGNDSAVETLQSLHLAAVAGDPKATRQHNGLRAYPLVGREPIRRSEIEDADERAAELYNIVTWLNCEKSNHLRYRPQGAMSFATTYAYDYCSLANAYLPRVWWTPAALAKLTLGQPLTPLYGSTVRELNANALLDWFADHGKQFGWQQTTSLDELQAAANNGEVAVILAQNVDLNRAGHVSVVLPERGRRKARRRVNGEVALPVQSQAGARNKRAFTGSRAWWSNARYREFAFWIHP